MIGTVVYGNFDINHRVSCYNAVLHSSFDAGLNRVDEFLRNHAANHFVSEFKALPASIGSRRSQQWPY